MSQNSFKKSHKKIRANTHFALRTGTDKNCCFLPQYKI